MKLTWYGHACFKLETDCGSVAFDPYAPGSVKGLKLPEITADAVVCSHRHSDHYCPEAVTLTGWQYLGVAAVAIVCGLLFSIKF